MRVQLVTEGLRTVESANRLIEICRAHEDATPIHVLRERLVAALASASRKYDTPAREQPKPANGVKESRRELERRMNWLRERIAECGNA